MPVPKSTAPADGGPSFDAFGPFLRFLRKRARLTQSELAIAVGYSVSQISLLETGLRLPELETIAALFVPALALQHEPALGARLLQLAAEARGDTSRLTVTQTVRREVTLSEADVMPPANLPAPLTSFIGRERELESLHALLTHPAKRLITVLGPPGVGKTRLALQAAWQHYRDFAQGAWFVDLAPIREARLVAGAIRQALGLKAPASRASDLDAVKRYVRNRQMLLVLDNYEHVLSSVSWVADLLTAAPHLKVLITSRAPLDLYGEHEFRLAPLPVPDLAHLPAPAALSQVPSVALFVERAQAIQTGFALSAANAPAIAAICVRLDGLPLALELAAVRIKHDNPQALAARLVERLSLERKSLRRHETLRATIDWSYDLLAEPERALLRRLGIFAGSFSLEAVQAVCVDEDTTGAAAHVDAPGPFDVLMQLVDKSLVLAESRLGERRYRLLETIRDYALEKLRQCGEADQLQRRHLEFFTHLAESAEDLIIGGDQKRWLDCLELEHDNFRAALQWSLNGADLDAGLRTAAALYRFWWVRGQYSSEGRQWLVRALAARGPVATLARARALRGLAGLEFNQGDFDAACAHYRESLQIFRQLGDTKNIALVMANLGASLPFVGRRAEARAYLQESLALHRELDVPMYVGYCLFSLGVVAHAAKDYANARMLAEQAMPYFRRVGHQQYIAAVNALLGMLAAVANEHERASGLLRDALALLRDLKNESGILEVLEALAYLAVAREEPEHAATLLAATESARAASGLSWRLFDTEYQATVSQVQAMLESETMERAWSEGQAMELEQAIEYALQYSRPNSGEGLGR